MIKEDRCPELSERRSPQRCGQIKSIMKQTQSVIIIVFGLLLVVVGFALALTSSIGPDSTLLGAGISLLGIVIFAPMLASGMAHEIDNSANNPVASRPFLRKGLYMVLIVGLLVSLKFGVQDLGTVRELQTEGEKLQATVISRDRLPATMAMGRAIYAYRVANVAVEDSFPIPRSRYSEYWTGRPLLVTYLPGNVRVHRLGEVNGATIVRQLLLWTLVMLNVTGLLGLPVLLLEMRARAGRETLNHGYDRSGNRRFARHRGRDRAAAGLRGDRGGQLQHRRVRRS